MSKSLKNIDVSVLAETDVLIVEGTIGGCVTALRLADRGFNVILCASGNSLPHEVAVCRRGWLTQDELGALPQKTRSAFHYAISHDTKHDEFILNTHKLAIILEDLLIDAGVTFYYGMKPCGVVKFGDHVETARERNVEWASSPLFPWAEIPMPRSKRASSQSKLRSKDAHATTESRLAGVAFAGKFGVQTILADNVVDCADLATTARLAGARLQRRFSRKDGVDVSYSRKVRVEVDRPAWPIRIDSKGNTVSLEDFAPAPPSERSEEGIEIHGSFAEFAMTLPLDLDDPLAHSNLVDHCRRGVNQTIEKTNRKRGKRKLDRLVFYRPPDDVLFGPVLRLKSVSTLKNWKSAGDHRAKATLCKPETIDNLWLCGPALDVGPREARGFAGPYHRVTIALAIAEIIQRRKRRASNRRLTISTEVHDVGERLWNDETVRVEDRPPLLGQGSKVSADMSTLNVIERCDVLVVGAGTSGVPAALAAARKGAKTILLDQHLDVGGTHTIGGTRGYWFGRDTGFQKMIDDALQADMNETDAWEAATMTGVLRGHGVQLLSKCVTAGAVTAAREIRGVVVAGSKGLAVIKAKVVIDATGDGDVAAWAGADYVYGNDRDTLTLWSSFASWLPFKRNVCRHYESCVDIRDATDLSRAIVTGRRRRGLWGSLGTPEIPQHYFTPRESRRIVGEKTVTYEGILAGVTFDDLICLCRSNFDIKGIASSDLIRCGFVWSWKTLTNYTAAIPYGALIPKELDNLLVVGKAYSADHDAMAMARMQKDLMALGGAAGLAAALAVKKEGDVRKIDVKRLQNELKRSEILSENELKRWGRDWAGLSKGECQRRLKRYGVGSNRQKTLFPLLSLASDSLNAFREAFGRETSHDKQVELARALCYLGDSRGVPFLVEDAQKRIQGELPNPKSGTLMVPPEHGWAAEPVYHAYAIGLTGKRNEAVPLLKTMAEKIENDAEAFTDKRRSRFEYVLTICQVAERSGSRKMIPVLETLLAKSCFQNLVEPFGVDPRRTLDQNAERRAYLRLAIGRALARCASPTGYEILIEYVGDARGFLARGAGDELAALTGKSPDSKPDAWRDWLKKNRSKLKAKAYAS